RRQADRGDPRGAQGPTAREDGNTLEQQPRPQECAVPIGHVDAELLPQPRRHEAAGGQAKSAGPGETRAETALRKETPCRKNAPPRAQGATCGKVKSPSTAAGEFVKEEMDHYP